MIFGILTAVIFALVSATVFTEKSKNDLRIKKILTRIHKPLGYLFIVLIVVHLSLNLLLIRQRSIIIYILGTAMLLCAVAAIIVKRILTDQRKALICHKLCALAIALLLITHVAFCVVGLDNYQQEIADISFSEIAISDIADGTYTGECDVNYIYAKVKVTVSGGVLTNIDLIEHRNERGKAGEGVIDKMLLEQHTDVDAVSGATNSSKVIKKAVENALENATKQ